MARHWKWVLAVAIISVLVSSFSDSAFAISNSTQANGTITNSTFTNSTAVNATIPGPITNQTTPINSTKLIPTWVKGIAGFWAEGKISDLDFQQAIQFLVNTGIIKVQNATSIISDLQISAQVNSPSNQTNSTISAVAKTIPFSWDTFYNSSLYWQRGNITDAEFFKQVQDAVNSGQFGPFNGTQDEKGKIFQEIIPNNAPTTHQVNFSKYYMKGSITIPTGDVIEWINDLNATHTVTSGTKTTGYDHAFFDTSIPAGGKTSFAFEGPGDFNFFSNYGWDNLNMTIHVIPNYHNVEVPSDLKTMTLLYAKQHNIQDMNNTVQELYRLGFVNNP